MSAHRITVIRCNATGCGAETHTPHLDGTAAAVRAFRKPEGWHTRPGGRDICPTCWTTGHR
ncbi:hypothetical protein ACFVYP_06950 [Kitasatospora sp. NPDC058201]|uniref:hypothetical protein n=1 Tax=unclassified Kitasatospora TaxID=2633591 RepID=UPI0036516ABF